MKEMDQFGISSSVLNNLVNEAVLILSDGEVTFGEVVHLGGVLAGKVSQFVHLSGLKKRELVIKVVEMALDVVLNTILPKLPEESQAAFRQKVETAAVFAKDTLPSVMDVANDAANGKIDLRDPVVQKTCWAAIKLILGCVGVQAPEIPTPATLVLRNLKEPAELDGLVEEKVKQVAAPVIESIESRSAEIVSQAVGSVSEVSKVIEEKNESQK
jgi:hypothetical protein